MPKAKEQGYVCPKCGKKVKVLVSKTNGPPVCFPKYPHTTKAVTMKVDPTGGGGS